MWLLNKHNHQMEEEEHRTAVCREWRRCEEHGLAEDG
jgi:hypothetical protein